MAQDTTAKRRAVLARMVSTAGQFVDVAGELVAVAAEKTEAGVFAEADGDYSGLTHLNVPYHPNVLAENIAPDLETWLDTPFTTGGGVPTRRQVLLQMLSGN